MPIYVFDCRWFLFQVLNSDVEFELVLGWVDIMGPNVYKDTKPECHLLLKLTSKGTWRQVFICLRPPIPGGGGSGVD
jgi:hypothetical protein